MAITIPTRAAMLAQAKAFLRSAFPDKDDHDDSFLGKWGRVLSELLLGLMEAVENADNDAIPNKNSSTEGLDEAAFTYGIPSGSTTAGGEYGRRGPVAATGGAGTLTGTPGTVFVAGTTALGPDGLTEFKLDGDKTIPGGGSIAGNWSAVTKGIAGNLSAGSVLTIQAPPSGGDSAVTLTTGLSGGLDAEENPSLLDRLLDRLQKPPKGGTASDYKTWVEETEGLTAFVYPRRGGDGTVHAVITQAGSGLSRVPSATKQDDANDFVNGSTSQEGTRPVTVNGFSVLLPWTAASGLALRVRCVPSLPKYAFDWSLGASPLTVSSYAAGPPGVITTVEALPTSLKDAVDAAGGVLASCPRIQVIIAGTVKPVQVRVTAYNSGAKTLTLENPLPSGFGTPANPNAIYPGGPMVDEVNQALLDYINSLGPSRESGHADELELWEDTCAIFRLGEVALATEDEDGTRFSKNVLAATINGAAVDVQADDSKVQAPELLYAASVACTD